MRENPRTVRCGGGRQPRTSRLRRALPGPLPPALQPAHVLCLLVDWTFTPHATGHTVSMTMHHYWRLRDGQIEYFRGSEDTALRRG